MIEIMLVSCIISKIKQLEAMIVHKCSLHTKHLDKMRHGFQSFHFFYFIDYMVLPAKVVFY